MTNEDLRIHEYNMDKIELYQDLIEQVKICLAIDGKRSTLDKETLDIFKDAKLILPSVSATNRFMLDTRFCLLQPLS